MFDYKGSLLDSISISESMANGASERFSDNLILLENMFTNPTALDDLMAVSEGLAMSTVKLTLDSQLLAEDLSKSSAVPEIDSTAISEGVALKAGKIFADSMSMVESKWARIRKYLTVSLTLVDSSKKFEFAFPGIKWMAACHGGI